MSYLLRMFCVCAAAFFLMHLATVLVVHAAKPLVERLAMRMMPRNGARLLFQLRLMPVSVSVLIVAGLCVPSYLRFEQDAAESIGLPCLLLSLLCLSMLLMQVVRAGLALRALASFERGVNYPIFALVGFAQPRLLVSDEVREALSAEQMDAATRHEEAHRSARDNWKRLAFLLVPDAGLAKLERRWAMLAEWAADDAAVQAEPRRAVALAEAMLRVARLSSHHFLVDQQRDLPISLLVSGDRDLSRRVDRLLSSAPQQPSRRYALTLRMAVALGMVVFVSAALHGMWLLSSVHAAMEFLVR